MGGMIFAYLGCCFFGQGTGSDWQAQRQSAIPGSGGPGILHVEPFQFFVLVK